jgi:SAM-dependent methyltransferase
MTMASEERFERDYYERHYRDYARQNPPKKLRFYRELAERAASEISRPRVLDVGCAFGSFLSVLNPAWQRFGIDVSEFATDLARRTVPDVTFEQAGVTGIPFPGPFDLITAFDVIEHVGALDEVIAAVGARLARGGHFIFVVPVYDGPTGPLVRLLDGDETHVHRRSRRFWLEWTARRFVVREWWGIYLYAFPGGFYLHVPTRSWRRFTPAIAVVTRNWEDRAGGSDGIS